MTEREDRSQRGNSPDNIHSELGKNRMQGPKVEQSQSLERSVETVHSPEVPTTIFEASEVRTRATLPLEVSGYVLSNRAGEELSRYVANLEETSPGQQVDAIDFKQVLPPLKMKEVISSLPENYPQLSENDFVEILRLALLTECATESYSQAFDEGSKRFNAPWLHRFNRNVWEPDELRHHDPFKRILMDAGFSEEELDGQVKETQDKIYTHTSGSSPVHLTTFGVIQEELTDNWYGLIRNILQKKSPDAAKLVSLVKRRETLHTVWYKDMTALQVADNPDLVYSVADALNRFQMPGNKLVPELQQQSTTWVSNMKGDFKQMEKDMARLIFGSVGQDVRRLGLVLVELAALKRVKAGPIPLQTVSTFLKAVNGRGAGLIGEAVLEHEKLNWPQSKQEHSLYQKAAEKLRAPARSLIAQNIHFNLEKA